MRGFDEAGIQVSDLLHLVVAGGNVLAELQGARKQRRRVPEKQERLIRLLADSGSANLDRLQEAFPKEWASISGRRKGQPNTLAHREFFRNIADIVGRINAALVAGYHDPQSMPAMLARTADRYLGFVFDYQEFTVSWTVSHDLSKLTDILPQSSSDHVRLTPPTASDKTGEEGASAHPPLPAEPSAPSDASGTTTLEVLEDPVTGVWSFDVAGQPIEVDRKHGLVKVDGRLYQTEVVKALDDVQDLRGAPLEFIKRVIIQTTE